MTINKDMKIGLTAIGATIAVLGSGVGYHQYSKQDHSDYAKVATAHPQQTFNRVVKQKVPAIVVFYSHDCQDCLSVQETVSKTIAKEQENSNFKFVVADKVETGSQFLKDNGIKETPTFQVRKGNTIIYSYSGTDKTHITKILKGINPDTDQPFEINNN